MHKEAVDHGDGDTAETSTEASLGLEVLDSGAEAGGDRLWLHEEELGFNGLNGVIERRIGVRRCDGFEDDGFWGFDHNQGGDQTTEGVGYLWPYVSRCSVSRGVHSGKTYHGRNGEEEKDGNAHDDGSPCWYLIFLLEVGMAHLDSSAEEGTHGCVHDDGAVGEREGIDEGVTAKESVVETSVGDGSDRHFGNRW